MRLLPPLGFGVVAAGIGVACYVRRENERTGAGYLAVLRQLPAQARSLVDDIGRRGRLAAQEGLQAAHMREEEVARQLAQAESQPTTT
jgi:hypothetical protein